MEVPALAYTRCEASYINLAGVCTNLFAPVGALDVSVRLTE